MVAGPIVHYQEVMPQFDRPTFRWVPTDVAVGICLFSIGLFKKVVIADRVADYANPLFAAPLQGEPVTLLSGWIGALAYTFQIYFDFSGYSDMALGIARIFGVVLPMNFNSPLKASSIVEFWGRWHITLTRFLTALSVYTAGTLFYSSAHGKRQTCSARTEHQSIGHRGSDRVADCIDDDDFGILAWSRVSVHHLGHSSRLDADDQSGVASITTTLLA